jgi:hypothetical protein
VYIEFAISLDGKPATNEKSTTIACERLAQLLCPNNLRSVSIEPGMLEGVQGMAASLRPLPTLTTADHHLFLGPP